MGYTNLFVAVCISVMRKGTVEDQAAIDQVLSGDYDAFEKLVEKYQGRVYRHLRKMVKDGQQAEDLLQETFLSAYKGLESFSGSSSFSTWLFRIATNSALMFLRKKRPESVEYNDEIGGGGNHDMMMHSSEFIRTPLEVLLSREGREKIEEAIEGLPVLYRTTIVLRDVEGFSLKEVADIMDTSVAAVKSRLHRARNSVRGTLSSYYTERDVDAN
ncbi:MAG: sigma-70 family RNA polymerase sigma factor [Desulfomonilaceae bacterium]|nr:sigma-70 family RNA polymerase sigma factor [Desulfomonilaceae bacterium]